MKIRDVILTEHLPLPPIPAELAYQFIVAGNGLWIRAEDSRIAAQVPVALACVHGLEQLEPFARLKVPKISSAWLAQVLESAQRHLPNEAMYQFYLNAEGKWKCAMPVQQQSRAHLIFDDKTETIVDVHSHGSLPAYFSDDDDEDEQGLRFYVVIGKIDTSQPQIAVRVGVYGHRHDVPFQTVFQDSLLFTQVDPDVEQVLMEKGY